MFSTAIHSGFFCHGYQYWYWYLKYDSSRSKEKRPQKVYVALYCINVFHWISNMTPIRSLDTSAYKLWKTEYFANQNHLQLLLPFYFVSSYCQMLMLPNERWKFLHLGLTCVSIPSVLATWWSHDLLYTIIHDYRIVNFS